MVNIKAFCITRFDIHKSGAFNNAQLKLNNEENENEILASISTCNYSLLSSYRN